MPHPGFHEIIDLEKQDRDVQRNFDDILITARLLGVEADYLGAGRRFVKISGTQHHEREVKQVADYANGSPLPYIPEDDDHDMI